MIGLHIACGVALLAANLVAGVWGGIAWLRREPTVGFWYALRVAQVTVVIQVMLGMVLVRPQGSVFVKMTGPASEVRAERERFRAFCESLRE